MTKRGTAGYERKLQATKAPHKRGYQVRKARLIAAGGLGRLPEVQNPRVPPLKDFANGH